MIITKEKYKDIYIVYIDESRKDSRTLLRESANRIVIDTRIPVNTLIRRT